MSAEQALGDRPVSAIQARVDRAVKPLADALREPLKKGKWYAKQSANIVTVSRCVLALPVWYGLWTEGAPVLLSFWLVGYVFVCLTDAVDGSLARQLEIHSRFGKLADGFADKMVIVVGTSVNCHNFQALPYLYLTTALLLVESGVAIVGVMCGINTEGNEQKDAHTFWGKSKFVCELVLVGIGLLSLTMPQLKSISLLASYVLFPPAIFLATMSLRSYVMRFMGLKAVPQQAAA